MMNKLIGHLKTITRHKYEVFKACCSSGIIWQGITHDISKYSPIEFWAGVEYYQGSRSPIDAEKEDKGYSLAWQHHKGRNPHHYEYWIDNIDSGGIPIIIPFKYVIEMVCDWIGSGKAYNPKGWSKADFLERWNLKSKTMKLHPVTRIFVIYLVNGFMADDFNFLKNHKQLKADYKNIINR